MFDPNLPQQNTLADAAQMRSQLNGLKDLIDAIPGVNSAVVDSVETLPPGSAATVAVSLVGTVLHLSFSLPQGTPGDAGQPGSTGPIGPQGPPFSQAIVDAVNTLPPGSAATVDASFDGTNVRFTFGIPRGNDGATGATGANGEVSQVDLINAITNTSANSNAVPTLDTPFTNDPPTLADLEQMRQAYNTLVLALRR